MRPTGIAARLAFAMLAVTGIALGVVAIGVMRVGADAFAGLMMAAGATAAEAHEMFDHSVAIVLAVAVGFGAAAAALVAWLFARRLARPIERLARGAAAVADGDLATRVPEEGPPELRALAAAYNVMADRLAEQEETRREFVVNASHELRTPLTNLQGYLEALRDGVMQPEPALLDSLREEVDRIVRLAASLDVLAGADGTRRAPSPVDLASVVRSSVDVARPAFARRSIAVDVRVEQPAMVVGRTDDLSQVMANLLQNAARYTPTGGMVTVTLERTAAGAVVRVANTGSRIPEDEIPRIWERFYRVDKSRDRASGGAGIGLAIVQRLVEDAGGRVGAASDAKATTFWFSLPVAPT